VGMCPVRTLVGTPSPLFLDLFILKELRKDCL
jgi:hypothetical protein